MSACWGQGWQGGTSSLVPRIIDNGDAYRRDVRLNEKLSITVGCAQVYYPDFTHPSASLELDRDVLPQGAGTKQSSQQPYGQGLELKLEWTPTQLGLYNFYFKNYYQPKEELGWRRIEVNVYSKYQWEGRLSFTTARENTLASRYDLKKKVYSIVAPRNTYYLFSRGALNKAILLLEGFDALNESDIFTLRTETFGRLLDHPDTPLNNGYDVWICDYDKGGDAIENNGNKVGDFIEEILWNLDYDEIVVIGYSMGGLVGRYALLSRPLPVSKFITLDTPHQGAQGNLSIQATVWFGGAGPLKDKVKKTTDMLTSAAAKDMLYYHAYRVADIDPYFYEEWFLCAITLDDIRAMATKWHDDFYRQLKDMGDYPKYCERYAIAFTPCVLRYQDKNVNDKMGEVAGFNVFADVYDIEPSSYLDWIEESDGDYVPKGGFDQFLTFIPLESSLDLRGIPKTNGRIAHSYSADELKQYSAFDNIFVKEQRTNHKDVDEQVLFYINDILGVPTAANLVSLPTGMR